MAFGEDIISQAISDYLGISPGAAVATLLVISIWTVIWKGLALWKAAGRRELVWFIVLLVVNTVGILEILYFFVFSEMNFSGKKSKKKKSLKKK